MSGWFTDASLPEHAVCLFAEFDLVGLHSRGDERSKETYGSRGSLLAWRIPNSSEVEVIEFFFDDLQVFFLWSFFGLGRRRLLLGGF